MKNRDAIKLFIKKEGKALFGKRNSNVFILIIILFVAIISIGFGSASLKYLSYKMEDPYINWIDIIADQKISDKSSIPILEFLGDTINQQKYHFLPPQANYTLPMYFFDALDHRIVSLGRSMDVNSDVFKKILEDKNIVIKRDRELKNTDLGIVVTEEFLLKELKYKDIPQFVELTLSFDTAQMKDLHFKNRGDDYYEIPIPILAVVKQLPGMYSWMYTERFQKERYSKSRAFNISSIDNNRVLTLCIEKDINSVESALKEQYGEDILIEQKEYDQTIKKYPCLDIKLIGRSEEEIIRTNNDIVNDLEQKKIRAQRVYDYYLPKNGYFDYTKEIGYYSVQMKDLDKVVAFRDALKNECGIKIEMTSIEAKENFRFVQGMGYILSVSLIIMSILFIGVFIYLLLNSHFQKIQRNLGTFKAFGISNKILFVVYTTVLIKMVVISFVCAFILAFIMELGISFIDNIEPGFNWINVITWQNLLLAIVALIASIFMSYIAVKKRLKNTPGNLIYNRI